MSDSEATSFQSNVPLPEELALAENYYALLGVPESASVLDIRRSYRELSKRYHPDTTDLPPAVAKEQFQKLQKAYTTLSDSKQRVIYDQQLRVASQRIYEYRLRKGVRPKAREPMRSSSAYLDPRERPLSAGEISGLFVMVISLLLCLLLAIAIAAFRGEAAFQPTSGMHFTTTSLAQAAACLIENFSS